MGTLGKPIKFGIETAPGKMMDFSGHVKDCEISSGIGGAVETSLTLIGTPPDIGLAANEIWEIPAQTPKLNLDPDITVQLRKLMEEYYPKEVIVKCESCGHWGGIKTECKHCGAPVG